ncbi:hypothetical protein Tco_1036484 [Tanacetum coccineum]
MIVSSIQIKFAIMRIMLHDFRKEVVVGDTAVPTVPSTEALVAEVVKCVNTSFSSLIVEIKNGIASGQKEIKDEVNELKKSLSSKSSTYEITKEVISVIEPEIKNIKDHITKIETPSFPSKELLVAEFVKFEISNLANKTQENVSTFKEFCEYFSNLQNSINVFENLVEESIPTKKEREEDQQLLDVISLDQRIIKGVYGVF